MRLSVVAGVLVVPIQQAHYLMGLDPPHWNSIDPDPEPDPEPGFFQREQFDDFCETSPAPQDSKVGLSRTAGGEGPGDANALAEALVVLLTDEDLTLPPIDDVSAVAGLLVARGRPRPQGAGMPGPAPGSRPRGSRRGERPARGRGGQR